jgi:anti-anti-sigma regulatory factor
LLAARESGAAVVVADLTSVARWDEAGLHSLLLAHRELVSGNIELRLVVWSRDLIEALHAAGITGQVTIFASTESALRAQFWRDT